MERQRRNPPHKKEEEQKRAESFLKNIQSEERFTIERIKELLHLLRTKYALTTKDLVHVLDDKEVLVPFSIFTKKLSILEAITKYLKEDLQISLHNIGILLNRNERNIWHTYNNTKKKHASRLSIVSSRYFFPLSIFQNNLSILENLVVYAKDELNLSFHQVAVLTERNDRNIWTMYQRAKKKVAQQ